MAEMKKKESKSSRLYSNSPTAKRDEADGKVKVMRPSDEETQEDIDTAKEPDGEGVEPEVIHHTTERREMAHRHIKERMDMHSKHEMEHAHADKGEKEEMHTRHEGELADMHHKHHSEMKRMHSRHEKMSPGEDKKDDKTKNDESKSMKEVDKEKKD